MMIVAIGHVFTRPGEQACLDWSDISHDKITIRRQGHSGKPRDKDRPNVARVRKESKELFSTLTSPGSIEARRQIDDELIFDVFEEGLRQA